MNQLPKAPKVSVCVITYNQEKYIRQCLQSIVDQETDFDFEVIVGEDCSTDGTRAIVQEFMGRYPGLIKGIFHDENIGGCRNYISVHSAALGDYIAHVDGDDLCCPFKLSRLVDYLNHNRECVAVFHRVLICDKDGAGGNKLWPKTSRYEKHDINQVLLNLSDFVHSSMFYRAGALNDFFKLPLNQFIDYQIYIHLASRGMVACLEANLGVYRYGVGESMRANVFELIIQAVEYAYKLDVKKPIVDLVVAQKCLMISKIAFFQGDINLFRKFIRKSFFVKIIGIKQALLFLFSYASILLVLLYKLKKSSQLFCNKYVF
jgi:glycosyltransferase involved in cell wall biosynthesis